MKIVEVLLCCFISIVAVCLSTNSLAQKQPNQDQSTQRSSVTEIIDDLNKTSFPHARVGLAWDGGESYRDSSDSMQSMNLMLSRRSESAFFAAGFTVERLDGCRLKLKNEQLKILSWYTEAPAKHFMSLSKFVVEGRKGEKILTPQSGVLIIPLDKVKYKDKSKPRFVKHEATAKLIGAWQTDFKESGFFKRSPFEMHVTAAEGPTLMSTMTAQTVIFAFDDKKESENFLVALRQAAQLCSGK